MKSTDINIESPFKIGINKGIIIGFCLLLFNFIIAMQFSNLPLDSGLKWNILSTITTYFLTALSCGKFWPENPWRWGFWLTIPYGFSVILLIMFYVILIMIEWSSERLAMAIVFSSIFLSLYFGLFLISSFGAYVGACIGARSRSPVLLTKVKTTNKR